MVDKVSGKSIEDGKRMFILIEIRKKRRNSRSYVKIMIMNDF